MGLKKRIFKHSPEESAEHVAQEMAMDKAFGDFVSGLNAENKALNLPVIVRIERNPLDQRETSERGTIKRGVFPRCNLCRAPFFRFFGQARKLPKLAAIAGPQPVFDQIRFLCFSCWSVIRTKPCSRCKTGFNVLTDQVRELQKLKPVDAYEATFDEYQHLCTKCWRELRDVACDACGTRFDVLNNCASKLKKNLSEHAVTVPAVAIARRICEACLTRHWQEWCTKCRRSYCKVDDCLTAFRSDPEVAKWLSPYHPAFAESAHWVSLCPACSSECRRLCLDMESRFSRWVGGTKGEAIRDFRIVRTLGRVEYKGTDCDEPASLETRLQLYAVQLGGNAFVKYYWEKQEERHSERVVDGYGPKGNPYYKTRSWSERWFTGYATAVFVEPFSAQRAPRR